MQQRIQFKKNKAFLKNINRLINVINIKNT